MRINYINNISFQKLPMKQDKGVNIIDDFIYRAQDPQRTMYTVTTKEYRNDKYDIKFQSDDELIPAASQQIKIKPKTIFVDSMFTNHPFQHKYGFGKSMHLLNIIEMFENNADCIELISIAVAIPFHTNMGFYPNDKWNEGLRTHIKKISLDDSEEVENYSLSAKLLLQNHNLPENARNIIGNNILNKYTKAAIKYKPKESLPYLFFIHTPMILRKTDVIKNKDFYNNLFNLYEIDYHID